MLHIGIVTVAVNISKLCSLRSMNFIDLLNMDSMICEILARSLKIYIVIFKIPCFSLPFRNLETVIYEFHRSMNFIDPKLGKFIITSNTSIIGMFLLSIGLVFSYIRTFTDTNEGNSSAKG